MKTETTYELVIETEFWPRKDVTVMAGFDSRRDAQREANKILDTFTLSERVRSRATIHEVKNHSNPWRA